MVAAVVLVAVLLLGWAILDRGETPTRGPAAQDTPSETASDQASETPKADQGPSADDMRAFVEDYLATAPSDPASTWERLTPGFQRKSGGFGSYQRFWSQFESATPGDISADPDRLLVSYGVSYTRKDGSTQSDSVTLQLEQDGDSLLIAGES